MCSCIVDLKFLIRPAIAWVHLKRKTLASMNTLASRRVNSPSHNTTHSPPHSQILKGVLWKKVLPPQETGSAEKKEGEKEAEKKVEPKVMKFDSDDEEDNGNDVDMDLAETTPRKRHSGAITHLAPLNNNIRENGMWAWQCSLIEENQIEGYVTAHHALTSHFNHHTIATSPSISSSPPHTPSHPHHTDSLLIIIKEVVWKLWAP